MFSLTTLLFFVVSVFGWCALATVGSKADYEIVNSAQGFMPNS
jgi:hypothetical protein